MGLDSLSPLDGRYREMLKPLATCFSESSFIRHRIHVELLYLEQLLKQLQILMPREFQSCEVYLLSNPAFPRRVKELEAETHHDVKAVEYAIAEQFDRHGIPELKAWLHWGLTSEDVNNLAYGCMLDNAFHNVVIPGWRDVLKVVSKIIPVTASVPMLARTHGQPASPTTVGKEFALFAQRILQELQHQKTLFPIPGKLNGATGNWQVQAAFYPDQDWLEFSRRFVSSLGLRFEPYTTQILPKEAYARLFDSLRRLNNIGIDWARDCWLYISYGYFQLKRAKDEVGSSTMPHKVNPIHFENAEGNFELANALLALLSDKLLKSRLQRDLSDSTVLRNMGVALGYSVLACQSLTRGLKQLRYNPERLQADLAEHWEVLSEPLQQALRIRGESVPYERLRTCTQGQQFTQEDFEQLRCELGVELPVQGPHEYTGLAQTLAEQVTRELDNFLRSG